MPGEVDGVVGEVGAVGAGDVVFGGGGVVVAGTEACGAATGVSVGTTAVPFASTKVYPTAAGLTSMPMTGSPVPPREPMNPASP